MRFWLVGLREFIWDEVWGSGDLTSGLLGLHAFSSDQVLGLS